MNNHEPTERISAIIPTEEQLELVIHQLIAESVARADISIQGTSEQIKDKYGVSFIDPAIVQDSTYPPMQDPFLKDDFGWVVGFSFAIPLFICLIIGIFIIGDVRSTTDNVVYGLLGAVTGTILGLVTAYLVKKNRQHQIKNQENKGGFLIWVTTYDKQQHQDVIKILKKFHLRNIEV